MEKREMICIMCPLGCALTVTKDGDEIKVTGNTCNRGAVFGREEMTCPKRVVTTSVKTDKGVKSVKTTCPVPKDKIFDVMREINRARVTRPMKRGEAVLPNVLGLGVDIIITSGLLEEKTEKENDHEQ